MNFEDAWDALEIGQSVIVANGQARPPYPDQNPWVQAWRSHNFIGALVERIEGEWSREMRFDLAPTENGDVVGYTIQEGVGHTFTVTEE